MRYAVLFVLIAAGCVDLAVSRGGPCWLLVWVAFSSTYVAACHAGGVPRLLGKRPDGSIAAHSIVALLPYFSYAWGVWRLRGLLTREPIASEVATGVWVGRRPSGNELPANTRAVVDLAAEFPAAIAVRANPGYLSIPTLDGAATEASNMVMAIKRLESTGGVSYIHCAFGHGRSAALAAVLLVHRGLASDVDAAELLMREHRPAIRLKASQHEAAAEALRILRT